MNADCPATQYCGRETKQCHPTGTGTVGVFGTCGADAECAPGTLCDDLLRQCATICDTAADCGGFSLTCSMLGGNRPYCSLF